MREPFPDIAKATITNGSKLEKVGMQGIEVPVLVPNPHDPNSNTLIPATADAYVDLSVADKKGIHMSRLFLPVQQKLAKEALTLGLMKKVLEDFLESHNDISGASFLKINFEMPMLRPALKSQNVGWRSYPISFDTQLTKQHEFRADVTISVLYSSTCPCSAALARQIVQQNFLNHFQTSESVRKEDVAKWLASEAGINATPHGQRSEARITLSFHDALDLDLKKYIDAVESALSTPVQAVVKREDEQEFARLNGTNLMFAEDAARKIKSVLNGFSEIKDFRVEAIHYESLHAHNAVAVAVKNHL